MFHFKKRLPKDQIIHSSENREQENLPKFTKEEQDEQRKIREEAQAANYEKTLHAFLNDKPKN